MLRSHQEVMGTVVSFSLSEESRKAGSTTEGAGRDGAAGTAAPSPGAERAIKGFAPGPTLERAFDRIARSATPPADRSRLDGALARAEAELVWVDEVFSTYKPQSPVSRLRRGEIELEQAPPEVAEVLELCRRARAVSDGWFQPWRLPGGVDPTGLVKGWAAERALAAIEAAGVAGAMVNAGGDIAVYGEPSPGETWRLAVVDPRDTRRLLLVAEFEGRGAIATSGRYERGDHLLVPAAMGEAAGGPRSRPAGGLLQATVIGPDLTFADALATALFVSEGELLERLGRLRGYHGIVVGSDGALRASPGFPFKLQFGLS